MREAAQSLGPEGGRAPLEADLHVTLCFLGAVEESAEPALRERVQAIEAAAFDLEFDMLEYWRRSRALVLTCSRVPGGVGALARELRASAQQIGLRPDEQPFEPHVTLLRGLTVALSRAQPPIGLPAPLRLAARRFHLAQSQALEPATASDAARARYQRLASWPLRAPHR